MAAAAAAAVMSVAPAPRRHLGDTLVEATEQDVKYLSKWCVAADGGANIQPGQVKTSALQTTAQAGRVLAHESTSLGLKARLDACKVLLGVVVEQSEDDLLFLRRALELMYTVSRPKAARGLAALRRFLHEADVDEDHGVVPVCLAIDHARNTALHYCGRAAGKWQAVPAARLFVEHGVPLDALNHRGAVYPHCRCCRSAASPTLTVVGVPRGK